MTFVPWNGLLGGAVAMGSTAATLIDQCAAGHPCAPEATDRASRGQGGSQRPTSSVWPTFRVYRAYRHRSSKDCQLATLQQGNHARIQSLTSRQKTRLAPGTGC